MIIIYLLFAVISHSRCSTEDYELKQNLPNPVIGVYFDNGDSMRRAFSLAMHTINKCMYDHTICEMIHPAPDDVNVHLFHQVEFSAITVDADDDLLSVRKNFEILEGTAKSDDTTIPDNENGLSLVMGPHNYISSVYIQGLCELHDIPHVIMKRESESEYNSYQTINLHPDTETIANVFLEMIKLLEWSTFTILYEYTDNFFALSNVLTMYPAYTHSVYGIKLGRGPNYSEPLLKARSMKHKSFLIDCQFDVLDNVLTQLQELGMMTDNYRYVITTLDIHAIDWSQYQYSGVHIKGLQMLDLNNDFTREFVASHLDDFGIEIVEQLRLQDALLFDAVMLFAHAFKDLNYQNRMLHGATVNFGYGDKQLQPWQYGLSLRNYMIYTELNGLTGPLAIDGDGARRRLKLDFVELRQTGLQKISEWNFQNTFRDFKPERQSKMPHYKVLIVDNPPYAMKINHSRSMEGNARYEGFAIDIIEELSKIMDFTYTFYLHDDQNNGGCEQKKSGDTTPCDSCDGVMGKILHKKHDMAIADLTVTENRARCVQFSTSFMNLGISILARKPQKVITWYSFLMPFDYGIWLYTLMSTILVSMVFFIIGRLCPAEWNNPYPCIDEPSELHNQFTINNAVWFVVGAFLQQGTEIAPIGVSTRILASAWYFFCLIVVNMYVANLAASLTIEIPKELIKDVSDLYGQTAIKYGAKINGATVKYFESASKPEYRQLYDQMMDPEWQKLYMVKSNEDGVELVKQRTDYVFFMESSAIEYAIKRNCQLQRVGKLIDHKYYAIAYSKEWVARIAIIDFPEDHRIRQTISLLEEKSVLSSLRKKWWGTKGGVCEKADPNMPEPLTVEQLSGVFIVLIVGLLFSAIFTCYASSKDIRSMARVEKLGFIETAKFEMKNIMQSKPIKPVLSKQRSSTETNLTDRSFNFTMSTEA